MSACGNEPGAAADPETPGSSATETSSPSQSPSEPTETTSEAVPEIPDWPACGEVWVADAKLPRGYKGCLDGDTAVKSDNLSCSSGQHIVRHEDRFYAVPGGKIYRTKGPLEKDKGYLDQITTCRG